MSNLDHWSPLVTGFSTKDRWIDQVNPLRSDFFTTPPVQIRPFDPKELLFRFVQDALHLESGCEMHGRSGPKWENGLILADLSWFSTEFSGMLRNPMPNYERHLPNPWGLCPFPSVLHEALSSSCDQVPHWLSKMVQNPQGTFTSTWVMFHCHVWVKTSHII